MLLITTSSILTRKVTSTSSVYSSTLHLLVGFNRAAFREGRGCNYPPGLIPFENSRVGSVTRVLMVHFQRFSESLEGDGMLNSQIWNRP